MRRLNLLAVLLLVVVGLQTADAQGFRVYKSDGTVAQFSLRTDSIVFYDGVGSDQDFGPFTPVNQMIVGTWVHSSNDMITFNEDGIVDDDGTTYKYKFLPYQGNLILYKANGSMHGIFKVYDLSSDTLVFGKIGVENFAVLTRVQPVVEEHEYVDLGLPSGTLWATCNVGASSPEEYGDYFAWGETEAKSEYNWSTYFDTEDGGNTFKKYYNNGGLTELLAEDDAATANWGSGWRMPSLDQIKELYNSVYTTTTWTTQNGVNGRKITSNSNGNSIFLPAAGYRYDTSLYFAGSRGYYWSRSLFTSYSYHAYGLYFDSSYVDWRSYYRGSGFTVRAVRVQGQ